MHEDYVPYEAAKLLKEKGFEWRCHACYDYDKPDKLVFLEGISNPCGIIYAAPTLYIAQKWLRETKNIHIDVYRNASGWLYNLTKADSGTLIVEGKCKGPNDGGAWDVYENCLNVAIANSLESI